MTVFLVGAGPGDPELITRKGAALLARADVVVFDRLVDARLVDEAPSHALRLDVGKSPWGEATSWPQEAINELLVDLAREYDCVVRLKGGDPGVFGRVGEEMQYLRANGIDAQIVPGVSSALAAPALADIALTHRGVASEVVVASGHDPDGSRWRLLGALTSTVVVLMGVKHRDAIARGLMSGGREPSTPVALIERAATPEQRRRLVTLEQLGRTTVASPAVMVIGDVAALGTYDDEVTPSCAGESWRRSPSTASPPKRAPIATQ